MEEGGSEAFWSNFFNELENKLKGPWRREDPEPSRAISLMNAIRI